VNFASRSKRMSWPLSFKIRLEAAFFRSLTGSRQLWLTALGMVGEVSDAYAHVMQQAVRERGGDSESK
jgi:hypothetical protein